MYSTKFSSTSIAKMLWLNVAFSLCVCIESPLCMFASPTQSTTSQPANTNKSGAKAVNKLQPEAPTPSPNPLGALPGKPVSGDRHPPKPPPGYQAQNPISSASGYPPKSAPAGFVPAREPIGNQSLQPGMPSENLIPEFGKAMPNVAVPGQNVPGQNTNYGDGSGFLTGQQVPAQSAAPSPDELRINRLEQTAFGSTYPEHELEDRLDHLEKEVLGASSKAPLQERLSKLEAKLGGSGAFSAPPAVNNVGSAPIEPEAPDSSAAVQPADSSTSVANQQPSNGNQFAPTNSVATATKPGKASQASGNTSLARADAQLQPEAGIEALPIEPATPSTVATTPPGAPAGMQFGAPQTQPAAQSTGQSPFTVPSMPQLGPGGALRGTQFGSPSNQQQFSPAPQLAAPPNPPQLAAPPNPPQIAAPPNQPQFAAPPNPPQFAAPPNQPQFAAQTNPPQFSAPSNPPQYGAPAQPAYIANGTPPPQFGAPGTVPSYAAPNYAPAAPNYGSPATQPQYNAPADPPYGAPAVPSQFASGMPNQFGGPASVQASYPAAGTLPPYGAPGFQPQYGGTGQPYGAGTYGVPGATPQTQYGAPGAQPYGGPQYTSASTQQPYNPPDMSQPGLQPTADAANGRPGQPKASEPDYFQAVRKFQGNSVARWRQSQFPVRIHLPAGSPDSWQKSLETGVDRWNVFVPLKVVPASEPANIEVHWVNHLSEASQFLGVTRLEIGPKEHMKVSIFMLRPTYYLSEIPEKTLHTAFLHELGHAVGIFGHSDSPKDLMFASEIVSAGKGKSSVIKFAPVISPRDVSTVKHIYSIAPASNEKIPQTLEWGYSVKMPQGSCRSNEKIYEFDGHVPNMNAQ